MKRFNSLLCLLMAIVVVYGCKEDVITNYKLSEKVKSLSGYNVGTSWAYDVEVNNIFDLEYQIIVRDTILEGRELFKITADSNYVLADFKRFTFNSSSKKMLPTSMDLIPTFYIARDSALYSLSDSVFLLGEYRVFTKDSIIADTFDIIDIRSFYTEYDGNNALIDVDTIVVLARLKVKGSVGPLRYSELVKTSSFINDFNVYNMGSTETLIEMIQNQYESDLNRNEVTFDIANSSSSGKETYKRIMTSKSGGSITAFLLTYNDGILDTAAINDVKNTDALGTYEVTEMSSASVNGKTYSDVMKIKSRYQTVDIFNNTQKKTMEYWLKPGFGIIKQMDLTDNITWSLKP